MLDKGEGEKPSKSSHHKSGILPSTAFCLEIPHPLPPFVATSVVTKWVKQLEVVTAGLRGMLPHPITKMKLSLH
jgi:hypothetical protein